MPEITPRTFKGTRDLLPEDMRIREKLISVIKNMFKIYGFAPLETPAIEFLEILAGKYGSDAEKLLYPLAYKGGKTLALRYDLTVPLARVIALNPHLPLPFKRYQIQPVWRADNPQLKRGRFREFYQCDVDTVGSDELLSDAEIISLMLDVFEALKFDKVEVHFNSRKVLRGIVVGSGLDVSAEHEVCRSIDKLDKEGLENVKKELLKKGLESDSIGTICSLLENRVTGTEAIEQLKKGIPANEALEEGLNEISSIIELTSEMDVPQDKVVFDYALARGLDYYTGPIFEVVIPDRPDIGSLAGGGRYDDLVSVFSKRSVPAVGTSFGLERIHTLIKERTDSSKDAGNDFDVLVCFYDKSVRKDCLELLSRMRHSGIRAEMYIKPDKMKKQFAFADKKNTPFVVILGPEEKETGKIKIKNMLTGTQKFMEFHELISYVIESKNRLNN